MVGVAVAVVARTRLDCVRNEKSELMVWEGRLDVSVGEPRV